MTPIGAARGWELVGAVRNGAYPLVVAGGALEASAEEMRIRDTARIRRGSTLAYSKGDFGLPK